MAADTTFVVGRHSVGKLIITTRSSDQTMRSMPRMRAALRRPILIEVASVRSVKRTAALVVCQHVAARVVKMVGVETPQEASDQTIMAISLGRH